MKLGRLQRFSAALTYYCAMIGILSIVSIFLIAQAQAQSKSSSANQSLDGLMKQLEELGGKGGQLGGQLGVGSAVDQARSSAVEGFARSPFSRQDEGEHPELKTQFSVGQLMLIERYCKSVASASDQQVLSVMHEFSAVERDYCLRLSERVLQIGYDVFDGI